MTQTETLAGTPVLAPTAEEYADILEREVHARMDMSVAEFIERYASEVTTPGVGI